MPSPIRWDSPEPDVPDWRPSVRRAIDLGLSEANAIEAFGVVAEKTGVLRPTKKNIRLTINDFINAFVLQARFRGAHPKVRDFYAEQYAALARFYGAESILDDSLIDYSPIEAGESGLRSLFITAGECCARVNSPFDGFLIMSKPAREFYDCYANSLDEAKLGLKRKYGDLMEAVYRKLFRYGDLLVTEFALIELFDFQLAKEPDVDEYW